MKPKIAVHKFSSCDGCQLAFLNAGEALVQLSELVDIVHFAEAGYVDEEATVDIAFIEGSVSTAKELKRVKRVRANSKYLIAIGACATSGGIQALRNFGHMKEWRDAIYPNPEFIDSLEHSMPVSDHVRVDLELWGCPVNAKQLLMAVRQLLFGVDVHIDHDSECMECKRQGIVCTLVTKGEPCMGPVTKLGCGALCPSVGRACYGCFGPSDNPNTHSLGRRFEGLGYMPEEIARKYSQINSHAKAFLQARKFFMKEEEE